MELQEQKDENDKRPPPTPPLGILEKVLGPFGKYQLWICFLIFVSKFFTAFNQMAIIFLAPRAQFTCNGKPNACPCTNPQYDTSVFTNTIVMEWNLICERKLYIGLTQTVFQIGTLLGSIIFGTASDKYGRRYPIIFSVTLQMVTSISAAYVKSYWTFTFIRLLIGVSVGGVMVTTFVLLMEIVGVQYRTLISSLFKVPYNIGHMLLPLFAYVYRDFRNFQLSIGIPSIILMVYICFMPESPRWLMAVERTNSALAILEKVNKVNNLQNTNIKSELEAESQQGGKSKGRKGTLSDLFRTPNLRKNIMCMGFIWMTCSYCFYGISQYVGQLNGNIFINVVSSAGVSLLGTLTSIPLMKVAGRKILVIIFNAICASCLVGLMFMPDSSISIIFASTGVVSSFIVFVVVYLYCSEMFPTVVRNAAIGYSSMMARVGSMVAPFIVETQDLGHWVPPLAFAILPTIACFVTFLLPETKDCVLMTTLEEGENFGKKPAKDNKI